MTIYLKSQGADDHRPHRPQWLDVLPVMVMGVVGEGDGC
jgi:hypothetical protein